MFMFIFAVAGAPHGAGQAIHRPRRLAADYVPPRGGYVASPRAGRSRFEEVEVLSQEKPQQRSGHTAVLYLSSQMIIFGGKDDDNNKLDDIWEFDFETRRWTQYKCTDQIMPL